VRCGRLGKPAVFTFCTARLLLFGQGCLQEHGNLSGPHSIRHNASANHACSHKVRDAHRRTCRKSALKIECANLLLHVYHQTILHQCNQSIYQYITPVMTSRCTASMCQPRTSLSDENNQSDLCVDSSKFMCVSARGKCLGLSRRQLLDLKL
jgi:hypothetical protein